MLPKIVLDKFKGLYLGICKTLFHTPKRVGILFVKGLNDAVYFSPNIGKSIVVAILVFLTFHTCLIRAGI